MKDLAAMIRDQGDPTDSVEANVESSEVRADRATLVSSRRLVRIKSCKNVYSGACSVGDYCTLGTSNLADL